VFKVIKKKFQKNKNQSLFTCNWSWLLWTQIIDVIKISLLYKELVYILHKNNSNVMLSNNKKNTHHWNIEKKTKLPHLFTCNWSWLLWTQIIDVIKTWLLYKGTIFILYKNNSNVMLLNNKKDIHHWIRWIKHSHL